MSKITLNNISAQNALPTAAITINNNNDTIEVAFGNTLSRDGTSPNQMTADFDMNSKRILNLPAPVNADEPLRYQDLSTFVGGGTVTNIPPGGNTNDVLTKASNTDYDVDWSSAASEVTAGANILVTGASPATVATVQNPSFTTSVTTPSLVLNGTTLNSKTGTGAIVLATSPTLITPALGTPSSGVATNLTGTAAGLTAGNVTTNANLTGDVTSVGNATTLTNAPVIAKVLTGYTSGAGTVSATDSIISAIQKLNGNDATNANLTGVITSVGNATSIASQTGTGTKFVVDTSPTIAGHPTIEGVTSTGATGTGNLVFATSPVIQGTPTLGTPAAIVLTNATGTASGLTAGNVTTNANLTGPITSVGNATTIAASPALTGTPTTTTAAVDTNTTQIASTAFVLAQAGSATPLIDGSATVGTSTRFARQDHIHPTDTTRAALASPTFTGTPAAPTAAVDTNTTQLATTAMVLAQAASATPLIDGTATVGTSTRYARADHVHPTDTTKVATVKKQVFTANGTYTPSAGMLYCQIECLGGGGGGGSAAGTVSSIYAGGGGGSGGYSRLLATAATIGASKAVTVGTGGTGGASGSNNGNSGNDTSVGILCVGKGGSGGTFGSVAQSSKGGAGGVVGTGDFAAAGNSGFYGNCSSALSPTLGSGNGGSSAFGGAAQGVSTATATAGNNATAYGSGGSGGWAYSTASTAAGGNGSDGVVYITEYCSQ